MLLAPLLGLLAPPACLACGRPPGPRDVLCRDCRVALPWLGPGVCARCGLPGRCGRTCPARRLAYDRAWAPVAYAGPARRLVGALKERGAVAAAGLMAAQMAATAPPGLLAGAVLSAVPADPLRRRRRGLDHAGRIAAELASRCDLEAAALLRRRPSRAGRQAGASRRQRLAEGRLPVEVRARAVPEAVLLVDDVHTTGATLHACAVALKAAGVRRVGAVTYARTL
ncbi:ComF family protein [Baekduia soli]|uniref:ComF family protein n=1 Tax=Baekduia soli TaxID=496014 RepID=A0A5B8U419_9ACTN|nr:double zinc ribbon domain-containing protein [Baekduia soli]QEC47747.1 ComF family protein [Baekduia soli]